MNKQVEQIRAEIKRREDKNLRYGGQIQRYKAEEDISILLFIDSMPKEPSDEDLKAEINRWLKAGRIKPKVDDFDIEATAYHFVEWQKRQTLNNAKLSGWVARDEDGHLNLFEVEPRRLDDKHRWWDRDYNVTSLDERDFPDLKWEDEPVYVKLIIIKED